MIRYNSACCHARLGNVEDGLAALKTALERGYDEYPAIRKDEEIASLREDPIRIHHGSIRAAGTRR